MDKGNAVFAGTTIGIDLGDQRTSVCVLDGAGEVRGRMTVATTEGALRRALDGQDPSRTVIEVGTHSPWVSRVLEGLGHEVIVANPRRVRLIAESDDKSDRVDAETLARLGRADPKLLHPIRHRGEQAQRDRAWLSVRDGLVRARVLLVNQGRLVADGPPQEVLADAARLIANRIVPTSLLEMNLQYLPHTGRFLRAEALAHVNTI